MAPEDSGSPAIAPKPPFFPTMQRALWQQPAHYPIDCPNCGKEMMVRGDTVPGTPLQCKSCGLNTYVEMSASETEKFKKLEDKIGELTHEIQNLEIQLGIATNELSSAARRHSWIGLAVTVIVAVVTFILTNWWEPITGWISWALPSSQPGN
jgi:predicted RNA-binding Zn-ribbon protein involved in translation (DUF1610 family)